MVRFCLSPTNFTSYRNVDDDGVDCDSHEDDNNFENNDENSYYDAINKAPTKSNDSDDKYYDALNHVSSKEAGEYGTESQSRDEEEQEHDYPHPLGFGRTRFGLYYDSDDDESDSDTFSVDLCEDESEVLIGTTPMYRLQNANETKALLGQYYKPKIKPIEEFEGMNSNFNCRDRDGKNHSNGWLVENKDENAYHFDSIMTNMDRIASIVRGNSNKITTLTTTSTPIATSSTTMQKAYMQYQNVLTQELTQLEQYKQNLMKQQQQDAHTLLKTIKKHEVEAKSILQMEENLKNQIEQEQRELRELREFEAKEQREKMEQEENDRQELIEQKKKKEKEEKQKELEQRKKEERLAAIQKEKYAYLIKAKELVRKLQEFRDSLKPFDKHTNAIIKKRRFEMKKVAKGKMNTLSHDKNKIQIVTHDIIQAINVSTQEDDIIKQEIQNGSGNFSREMARGTKYLIDLIASNVIVRIEADGFNGTRGDGFPMAHALASCSTQLPKEFVKVLEAHIYNVCPTAIPTMPALSSDCKETELMESLRMKKGKDGKYETFDRFLARTESIISFMAATMCSTPSDHTLFGGPKLAIVWLGRFLDLLPEEQSPLPLLTAPVLVAFLTAAGHMLANEFINEFQPLFDKIAQDVINRLDISTLGQPSVTRLKKLLSGGMSELKSKIPPGCISEFYNVQSISSTGQNNDNSLTFSQANNHNTANSNPFGYNSAQAGMKMPFSQTNITGNATNLSPFNNTPQATNQAPFSNTTTNSNPFGFKNTIQNTNVTHQSPFNNSTQAINPSPFANTNTQKSPFGNSNQSGFNNSQQNTTSQSPFNSTSTAIVSPFFQKNAALGAANPSPFNNTKQTTNSSQFSTGNNPFSSNIQNNTNVSNFGSNNLQSTFNSSSFGVANRSNESPFGSSSTNTIPYGATNTSPFGSSGTNGPQNSFGNQSNPFGNSQFSGTCQTVNSKAKPCKYFAQGKCRYGANCKFSHDPAFKKDPGGFNSHRSSTSRW